MADHDPFVEAQKAGGKHHGFYRHYSQLSSVLVNKAIRSLQQRVAEHQDKIANPQDYVPNFQQLDERQQQALTGEVWPQEIGRFEEQIAVLQGILKQRESGSA